LGGRTSKAAGKTGERRVKTYLTAQGWLVADQETQGLAGDDLFAKSPSGVWFSIEVKNTRALPAEKYYQQAATQAAEREKAVCEALTSPLSSVTKLLVAEYRKSNFILVWLPTGVGNGKDSIAFVRSGGATELEIWKGC
jgi:Holliday junction resolvase-like predicted endonuclease